MDTATRKPTIEGTEGPVAVGDVRRFLSTLQDEDGHNILVRRYTDQRVTVIAQIEVPDDEDEEPEAMWQVRAEDGTEFAAWESELLLGGTNVYVMPNGEYVANPEWRGWGE